jgi:hypothetical protein
VALIRLHLAVVVTALYFHARLSSGSLLDALTDIPNVSPSRSDINLSDLERACLRTRARLGLPCLPTALAARSVLAMSGTPSKLVMGVDPGNVMDGHAWLVINNQEILKGTRQWRQIWQEE